MTQAIAGNSVLTRHRARPRLRPGSLALVAPILVVVGLFVFPVVALLGQSLDVQNGATDFAAWQRVLGDPAFLDALWRIVSLAVCASAGATALGTFGAVVLVFARPPGSAFFGRLIDAVVAFPSLLIALAFTVLYGSAGVLNSALGVDVELLHTFWGVVLAEITFYTPFVLRPMTAALSQVPRKQLEVAASLGAKPLRVLRSVVLPHVMPALASGLCLTLLMTMNEFGIVLFSSSKEVQTLPKLIYDTGLVAGDLPAACVLAIVNAVLSMGLYLAYRAVLDRRTRRA